MLSNYRLEKENFSCLTFINLQYKSTNWDTTHQRPFYHLGWDWFVEINWDENKFIDFLEKLFCRKAKSSVEGKIFCSLYL